MLCSQFQQKQARKLWQEKDRMAHLCKLRLRAAGSFPLHPLEAAMTTSCNNDDNG